MKGYGKWFIFVNSPMKHHNLQKITKTLSGQFSASFLWFSHFLELGRQKILKLSLQTTFLAYMWHNTPLGVLRNKRYIVKFEQIWANLILSLNFRQTRKNLKKFQNPLKKRQLGQNCLNQQNLVSKPVFLYNE